MPAAAVIPAPVAYANAVAVKKLVVESQGGLTGLLFECVPVRLPFCLGDLLCFTVWECST